MDTEYNQEKNDNSSTIIEGSNMLKIDGPIGRKEFVKTYVLLALCSIVFYTILALFLNYFDINFPQITYLPWFILIVLVVNLLALYISLLNYVKRIYDLTGDKQHSIFYTIAIFIGTIAASFIPVINVLGLLTSIVIFMVLLFKKGQTV